MNPSLLRTTWTSIQTPLTLAFIFLIVSPVNLIANLVENSLLVSWSWLPVRMRKLTFDVGTLFLTNSLPQITNLSV